MLGEQSAGQTGRPVWARGLVAHSPTHPRNQSWLMNEETSSMRGKFNPELLEQQIF